MEKIPFTSEDTSENPTKGEYHFIVLPPKKLRKGRGYLGKHATKRRNRE